MSATRPSASASVVRASARSSTRPSAQVGPSGSASGRPVGGSKDGSEKSKKSRTPAAPGPSRRNRRGEIKVRVHLPPIEAYQKEVEFRADGPGRVVVRLERLMGSDKIRLTDPKFMSTFLERLEEEEMKAWARRTRERKRAEKLRSRKLAIDGLMEPTEDMQDLYAHPVYRVNQVLKKMQGFDASLSVGHQEHLPPIVEIEPFEFDDTGAIFKDYPLHLKLKAQVDSHMDDINQFTPRTLKSISSSIVRHRSTLVQVDDRHKSTKDVHGRTSKMLRPLGSMGAFIVKAEDHGGGSIKPSPSNSNIHGHGGAGRPSEKLPPIEQGGDPYASRKSVKIIAEDKTSSTVGPVDEAAMVQRKTKRSLKRSNVVATSMLGDSTVILGGTRKSKKGSRHSMADELRSRHRAKSTKSLSAAADDEEEGEHHPDSTVQLTLPPPDINEPYEGDRPRKSAKSRASTHEGDAKEARSSIHAKRSTHDADAQRKKSSTLKAKRSTHDADAHRKSSTHAKRSTHDGDEHRKSSAHAKRSTHDGDEHRKKSSHAKRSTHDGDGQRKSSSKHKSSSHFEHEGDEEEEEDGEEEEGLHHHHSHHHSTSYHHSHGHGHHHHRHEHLHMKQIHKQKHHHHHRLQLPDILYENAPLHVLQAHFGIDPEEDLCDGIPHTSDLVNSLYNEERDLERLYHAAEDLLDMYARENLAADKFVSDLSKKMHTQQHQ